jgi:hypothetical protein
LASALRVAATAEVIVVCFAISPVTLLQRDRLEHDSVGAVTGTLPERA